MSTILDRELFEAVKQGDLNRVRELVESGAQINACPEFGYCTLEKATGNKSPRAFEITRYLVEQGADVNFYNGQALRKAAGSTNPDALEIVKLLVDNDANVHLRDDDFLMTPLIFSLRRKNRDIADYFLSRDDFLLSDFMPNSFFAQLSDDVYSDFRAKAISHVSEMVDAKGIPYAKKVAADIEEILKGDDPKPTQDDIEVFKILTKKIASKDWVSDAKVSSDDFMGSNMER